MLSMPSRNKLSIYKIKDEFVTDEDIIDHYNDSIHVEGVGTIYLEFSQPSTPKWVESFFQGYITKNRVFTANARAVLLVRISVGHGKTKVFVITMGYGKSMLKDDVVEERFGLKVILNTIKPDSLRRISKVNIGGNQKLSNEQLPLKSEINDFGLDINRDLVSNIAGISDDEEYVTGMMAGGDILSVTADVDITSIVDFLHKTYHKYCLNSYRENFGWIDQIQDVKDIRLIDSLNDEMITAINGSSNNIWMAVPEIINWADIKGFKYCGHNVYDDIDINVVKTSFRDPLTCIDQLKSKRILAINAIDDTIKYNWGANRCLYGELSLGRKCYCINSGKWYRIDNDFVNQVNHEYEHMPISSITFDDFNQEHTSENSYSISFQNKHPNDYVLMDRENISYGGGNSKIELCDILSRDKELIHVKPYSGSATLSHLFSQAAVSAELILSDAEFLELANRKIAQVAGNNDFNIINRRSIKIVFGIISKQRTPLPHLPFFSKVSLRHTKRLLEAFDLEVSIKTINDIR